MRKYYTAKCDQCKKDFERLLSDRLEIKKNKVKGHRSDKEFCSKECFYKFRTDNFTITGNCDWCNKEIVHKLCESQKSKSGRHFCSLSCSASYNNTQKRLSKRSKCEIMLFDLLKEKYTSLDLVANGKKMLEGMECDIEIASLSLAIEWNGIVHYKPIYGEEKLRKIQSVDERKQNLAQQKGIRLIVVPDLVSNEKYVKEAFYNICKIIDELMSE